MSRKHLNSDFPALEPDGWNPLPTWFIWTFVIGVVVCVFGLGLLFGAFWELLK